MPHAIKYFEMHLTHTCNLNCDYCSHYCNVGYPGDIDFGTGREWLAAWSKRISPEQIRLLGGEPLLHPDLDKYILATKELFPRAKRTVTTNGILLDARKDLLPLMVATGTRLNISLHPVPPKWEENIRAALRLLDIWEKKGLIATVHHSHSDWFLPYRGSGRDILPFAEGKPDQSFDAMCRTPEKRCLTLHEGKFWQCPQLAYLPLVIDKLTHKSAWEKYLAYKPLSVDASDEEFTKFLSRDTAFCDICPAVIEKIDPQSLLAGGGGMVAVRDEKEKSRKRWRAIAKARLWLRELAG